MKERYDHQKTVILPKACYDWLHLRPQDFKSVTDYNSALFKISSQLKLCAEKITDEDMLEKTYTTFHASNVLLQQQYRKHRFTKYSELIACLLVAEQNNELLLKNHQSHPSGSIPCLKPMLQFKLIDVGVGMGMDKAEAVVVVAINSWNRGNYNQSQNKNKTSNNQKLNRSEKLSRKATGPHNKKVYETECYRCGMKGH